MRMSRVLVVAVSVLVLGALVGGGVALALQHLRSGPATRRTGPDGTIPYLTGPNDLLLRVSLANGLLTPVAQAAREPAFSLYGNGTVIVDASAANAPSPPPASGALPDLRTTTVTAAGVGAILQRARSTGLFGPSRSYLGGPADAATEVFAITLGSVHRVQSFLGGASRVSSSQPPGERAVRERFAEFEANLMDLSSWLPPGAAGPTTSYASDRMAVFVGAGSRDQHAPSTVDWPVPAGLARFGQPSSVEGFRCAVVSGSDLANLAPVASKAGADALWRSGPKTYPVVFRPLLPDDLGC